MAYDQTGASEQTFWSDPNGLTGTVYKSNWIEVEYTELPHGRYGQVLLTNRPFKIQINNRASKGRSEVSLMHEIVHVMDQLYKLNLTHERVHDIATFMVNEAVPAVVAAQERN